MQHTARRMWSLLEPVHAVTYFAEQARAAADAAGYRGFWMGYCAMRMAPLGAVGPEVATSVFYGFSPTRAAAVLPDAWRFAPPERALQARLDGAQAALQAAWSAAGVRDADVAEAAALAQEAARAAETAGRVLAAGNQALPEPGDPEAALWQAATVLREHRGDGHNAALVAAGIGPVQAHLLKEAAEETEGLVLRAGRGWPQQQWDDAAADLVARGWLTPDLRLTPVGTAERDDVEARTDEAAAGPWRALGPERTERLAALLHPLATAVLAAGAYRLPNPMGSPPPAAP